MEKNGTFASPAIALAKRVLPVPGGPTNNAPVGILPPSLENFFGSFKNSTTSSNSCLASSIPATSSKVTLPMASLIAIAFVYFEHNSVEKTVLYAKSILVAVPVSYLFFLPFFLAKQFNMNFWMIYGSGILLLALGFFIHKYFANFL